ncbi:MAG: hypothetical protein CMK07_00560 [Ponticaulis sp.]|nr:hypothetical protein [Ponticaulis sp.]
MKGWSLSVSTANPRPDVWLRIGVVALAATMLCFGLSSASGLVFDETHYVPAARDILTLAKNRNPEHPLFAKEVIAASIALFGDTEFGWRFLGAVLNVLGVMACFEIALRLFRSPVLAALTALLVLLNMMYVVQARVAMLDTYTYPLFALSAACLFMSADDGRSDLMRRALLVFGGVLLGCATGAKWIAGIYAVIVLFALAFQRLIQTLADKRALPDWLFGTGFPAWTRSNLIMTGLWFGVPSLIAYLLTCTPMMFWTQDPVDGVTGIVGFHFNMLNLQTMPLASNSYESDWWSWPLMIEPIWYYFTDGPNEGHKALLYVCNPAIAWGGILAAVSVLVEGIRRRSSRLIWLFLAWFVSWMIFAILPKQIGFLFYYHGAAMLICFVIVGAISILPAGKPRKWAMGLTAFAAAVIFLFFLPVVYAIEMPATQWLNYLWMKSWA